MATRSHAYQPAAEFTCYVGPVPKLVPGGGLNLPGAVRSGQELPGAARSGQEQSGLAKSGQEWLG